MLEDLIPHRQGVEESLISATLWLTPTTTMPSNDTKGNGKVSTSSSAAAASGSGTAAEDAGAYKFHSSFEGHEGTCKPYLSTIMTTLSSRAVDVQSLRKEGEGANASTGESRRDAHTEYVLRFGQREKGAQESGTRSVNCRIAERASFPTQSHRRTTKPISAAITTPNLPTASQKRWAQQQRPQQQGGVAAGHVAAADGVRKSEGMRA